jgi:hypothetical protein
MTRRFRGLIALCLAAATLFVAGPVAAPVRAAGTTGPGGLLVSVGYAEDKETNNPDPAAFPVPWAGSPNVVFLGNPVVGASQCGVLASCFDAGAIRLDNPTGADIAVSDVTVDDHSSLTGGKVFDLWGAFVVPAGHSVILTQNPPGANPSFDNFDTSSYPGNQCTPITVAPTVTITVSGVPTTLADSTHLLDTGGIDKGFCNTGAARNESAAWRPIGAAGTLDAGLSLAPEATTRPVGASVSETATLLDGGGNALVGVAVAFSVTSGPNAGRTGAATTDASGHATFSYTDSAAGTDVVEASVTTVGIFSAQSMAIWGPGAPPWTGQDIGSPPVAGADSFGAGAWTVSGSGRDIGGTSDQFHFVWQPRAGNVSLSARVVTQTNTNGAAKSGLMLRQSTDPAAPLYGAFLTPGSGVVVIERASFGGPVAILATLPGVIPIYLEVTRTGSSVSSATSPDGSTWTSIPGSAATLSINGVVLAGMAVTSHSLVALSTADFDSVVLMPPAVTVDHLVLSPSTATVNSGVAQPYTAEGFDAANQDLGDFTAETTFGIAGGGSCTGTSCSSTVVGAHTVTGTDGTATGSATLHVNPLPGDTYHAVAPARLLDTRNGTGGLSGPLASHVAETFSVTGGVVPVGATAVTGNLTVTGQSSFGYLFIGPVATNNPTSSTLNFPAGDNRANAVTVALGTGGTLSITLVALLTTGTADAVFDVTGYFTADTSGDTYHAVAPARLLDTRNETGGLSGPLASHVAETFSVTGGVVPVGATAVTGNLTVTGQTSYGYLFIGPVATNNPTSSTLNFPAADDRANAVTVALGAGGTLSITLVALLTTGTADAVFDVTGYFTADTSGAFYVPLAPARILDTRDGTGGLTGPFGPHSPQTFAVGGRGGVSAAAIAVTGNLTVTGQTSFGYLSIGPVAIANPTTSTLNFPLADNRANAVDVALSGPGGSLSVTYVTPDSTATTECIFDVTGYFVP